MGLSLVELSWSDAGGALRPLIASGWYSYCPASIIFCRADDVKP